MNNLKLLPIPGDLAAWRVQEVERLRAKMLDPAKAVWRDGALHWRIEGRDGVEFRCLGPDMQFKDALIEAPEAQQAVYDRATERLFANYRRARANMSAEQRAEEAFERRAAFGPGVDVVDVITGERFRS